MGRLEVSCRRFAILSGVEQDPADYAVCVHPSAPGLQRKGTLATITETAGSFPGSSSEACKIAQNVVVEKYFTDGALSLTSSLLNALDHANTALLQYNYASASASSGDQGDVAVQGGGIKQRRAKVGMTALLIRPDGAGIYLSQTAPTQAYVLHNSMLSAIPEPLHWRQVPQPSMAITGSVEDGGEDGAEIDGDAAFDDAHPSSLPAPSLGSGPGIEADLVYRRIAAGDMVVLVSTSLSRHLDRAFAEQLFARYDADGVINALHNVAVEKGLAEAHACVLELGVLDSSGVEEYFVAPGSAQQSKQIADNGGVIAPPQGPQRAAMPTMPSMPSMQSFKDALRGPREWLQRRKAEPEQIAETVEPVHFDAHAQQEEYEQAEIEEPRYEFMQSAPAQSEETEVPGPVEIAGYVEQAEETDQAPIEDIDDGQYFWSKQPTQLFTHRPSDLPPYKIAQQDGNLAHAASPMQEWSDEELEFDGWEDAPPALDDPQYDDSHKVVFKPALHQQAEEEDIDELVARHPAFAPIPIARSARSYKQPALFDGNDFEEAQPAPTVARSTGSVGSTLRTGRTLNPVRSKFDIRGMAGTAGNWLATTGRSMIPEKEGGGFLSGKGIKGIKLGTTIPMKVVIGAALAIAALLFIVSIMSMASNGQKAATRNILQDAQQMETLANQPGLLAADRQEKLQLALSKAQEAAAANPQAADAKLLVTKIQNELDQAQGITRFGSVKLLFDVTGAGVAQNTISNSVPLPVNDIIVQGNDAFVLDRAGNKLYRCQLAAATCTAVLSGGETAGGQQVGTIVGMATRVGSLVAVDDKFVSYSLSQDTGAWQALALGGTDGLQTPKDIASFDGNLYLLEAKPGQISKYLSGQYDQAPVDWISDQGTIDAMKAPVAIAVDGEIYVTLADGSILIMQGGKLDRAVTPKVLAGQGTPTRLFTNTDVHDLYLLRAEDGTITHISKDGQVIATLKAPAGSGLDKLSGMTVDEAKGKYYLVEGSKVYEATLGTTPAAINPASQSTTVNVPAQTQPASGLSAQPTASP